MDLPENLYFSNWLSFQSFKNEHCISIHPYLIKTGLDKTHTLKRTKIFVDDTAVEVAYVLNKPITYTFEKGLNVSEELDQFI